MKIKTAIVTGASGGFGLLSVIELAKEGFHVIASMRDLSKSDLLMDIARAENVTSQISLLKLDVTNQESIMEFTNELPNYDRIDVLVNNAGFALGGFVEELPIDEYRRQFETNFFGVISITQAVLPFMRAQKYGRIINMSSISGQFGFPGLSPYVSSKHALEGFSESLRLEVKPFGIDVVLIEPGSYRTNIWSSVDKTELVPHSPYHRYMSALLKEIQTGKAKHGNPIEVAKLVAQVASQSRAPKLRYPVGKGIKSTIFFKNILPWKLLEKFVLKKLLKLR